MKLLATIQLKLHVGCWLSAKKKRVLFQPEYGAVVGREACTIGGYSKKRKWGAYEIPRNTLGLQINIQSTINYGSAKHSNEYLTKSIITNNAKKNLLFSLPWFLFVHSRVGEFNNKNILKILSIVGESLTDSNVENRSKMKRVAIRGGPFNHPVLHNEAARDRDAVTD